MYRCVNENLESLILDFLSSDFENESEIINSDSFTTFNKFILESFNTNQSNRFSICQLALFLQQHGSTPLITNQLLKRYIYGLYLLSLERKNSDSFVP